MVILIVYRCFGPFYVPISINNKHKELDYVLSIYTHRYQLTAFSDLMIKISVCMIPHIHHHGSSWQVHMYMLGDRVFLGNIKYAGLRTGKVVLIQHINYIWYRHCSHFVVISVGFKHICWVAQLAQAHGCPSAREVILVMMVKHITGTCNELIK